MRTSSIKYSILGALLAVVVVVPFWSSVVPAYGKTIELRVATYVPPNVHLAKAIDWWAAELEKRTKGNIKTTVFHGQTLGKAPDSLDMLKIGTAQVCLLPAPAFPGRFPVTELITDTPLLRGNIRIEEEVLNRLLSAGMLKEYDDYKVISWFTIDPMMLFTNKPIANLEDLKGKKIRARGRSSTAIVEKLGASPVALEVGDLYSSLERGVIDGVTTPITAWAPMKLYEVSKFLVDETLYGGLAPVLMSKKTWAEMTPETKLIIDELNRELTYVFFDLTWVEIKKGYQLASSGGRQIIKLSPVERERWFDAMSPVTDQALSVVNAKGLPAKEIMSTCQDVLEYWKVSGIK